MNFRQLGFYFFVLVPFSVIAQTSPSFNSAELKLGLKKLNVLGSALYIAAHPDDENTRLLAYLAKEKKFRTGYLSLTRGDGGQNLIGNEQSELLGLIRTQELLAARRTDGAEQFFSRAIDFGFSKTSDETFRIWNKEQILADAVWVIRNFKPDVIITRFPEDARAGHGHHAASAIIAREAFLAAADPKRFPEQLKFVEVWAAKRLVWNTFNFGGLNTTSNDQIKLDVGAFNPLLGKSYGEIAAESRTNHKSQGFGSAKQRGQSFEYFSHTTGTSAKEDILEDINANWNRIPGGIEISRMITLADKNFDIDNPSKSVPSLINILNALEKLPNSYWKDQKSKELKDLIAGAAGLWFESYASEATHALGDQIKFRSDIVLQSHIAISIKTIDNQKQNAPLQHGILKTVEGIATAQAITEPYWLEEKHELGTFKIDNQQLIGKAENSAPIKVKFTFNIAGKEISYERDAVFKSTDLVRGEVYQPLVIAPAITASISEKAYVFIGNNSKKVQVQLKSFRNASIGTIVPQVPLGWLIKPERIDFELLKKGDEKAVEFEIIPTNASQAGNFALSIETAQGNFNRGHKLIDYEHIPLQTLFPLTEAKIERIDLQTSGKKIGYLSGAGDLIPESLEQIGFEVNKITEADVMNGNLSQYDAIIAGLRAYNVNERLSLMQTKLMEYVQNGGTYLVQYNVSSPLLVEKVGPYPFKISRDRVTEEDATVTFLEKDHPVLNYPNKITSKDFEGWVQERGLYFLTSIDPKYKRILSMNDQGESAKDGSLIVADYGKGRFVYTSLAFFRELPAGIPGAYRLFVNLITK
jgi:LmbE family N-acetylglucosaminyl deacetylase